MTRSALDPSSPTYIIFAIIFPTVGVILSCIFSLTPIPRLREINKRGTLGDYDPNPAVLNLAAGMYAD